MSSDHDHNSGHTHHDHQHGDDHSGFGGHHHHAHGAGHSHAPANFGKAFAIGIVLNSVFVVIEALYGYWSGSMALVADAGHNLSDVLALLIAWGATIMATKPASARFTYGFKSSSILAAMTNAGLLMLAVGAISIETARRFFEPAPVEGQTMIVIAGIGIVINTVTALMFMRGRKHDINIRGAFLHMAADALVSLGVVIAGVLIMVTDIAWIDPATSLLILVVIAWGTWGLARDSVKMGLLAVPDGIDEAQVREYLMGLDGVSAVHDLHIWPMSTTETALTAHLVTPDGHPGDALLNDVSRVLEERFSIHHSTIQMEVEDSQCESCS